VRNDLVEGRRQKAHELQLRHRPQTQQGHAEGDADNPRLGQRCIDRPFFAEGHLQTLGHPEDAPLFPHVLAEQQDG